jgi:tetratricopeptide (TPR) repeat protein
MKKILLLTLFLVIAPFIVLAQDIDAEKAPAWLLMELGEKAYRDKEFGEALSLFREVKKREGIYPEADYWIGLVFEADAEIDLAIKQLEMAYENRNQLFILAEKYTLLYKLAELYKRQGNFLVFEEKLREIIRDDEDFNSVRMEVLVRLLQEKGFDNLLKLYRFTSDFAMEAHLRLGTFLHESGRNPQGIEFVRAEDPEYAFADTSSFLNLAGEYRELDTYFTTAGLYPGIYVLAQALNDTGHVSTARELWKIVAEHCGDLSLRNRARRDLR